MPTEAQLGVPGGVRLRIVDPGNGRSRRDDRGRVPGPAGSTEHVTTGSAALEIGRLLSLLGDAALVTESSTGRIVLWNRAAESLFGYSADQACGQPIEMMIRQPVRDGDQDRQLALDAGVVLDALAMTSTGQQLAVELTWSPLDGGDLLLGLLRQATVRAPVQATRMGLARPQEARQAAESVADRLTVLDQASSLLSTSHDEEVGLRSVMRLVVPRLADWCILDIVADDGAVRRVDVTHADPAQHELAEHLRRLPNGPGTPGSPAALVVEGGESMVYADAADLLIETSGAPEHRRLMGTLVPCSAMVVPLRARGRTLGALWLVSAESGRRYTRADLPLVEELARRCALSVDNARILAAERRERVASQTLQAITAALSRALTPADVAQVIIQQGLPGIGADAGAVALLDESGARLELLRTVGYPPDMVHALQSTPVSGSTPMAQAARSGQPVWREAGPSAPAAFPDYARVNRTFAAGVALPLSVEGRVVGALALSFTGGRAFDAHDRTFATALAAQCALALERARLYEAERRARAAAEASAAQLDVILGGVADGIVAQDPSGTVIYANDAAARLVGFPSAQALTAARPPERLAAFELLDVDDRPLAVSQLPGRRALLGEVVEGMPVRFRVRASGEERWALVSAAPVPDSRGRVSFAITIFRDITAQQQAQERLAFLAEASTVLSASLDYELTLTRLGELAVPRLADACVIDLLQPGGRVRRLPMIVANGAPAEVVQALESMDPPELDGPGAAARVLRTGEPIIVPVVTDEVLAAGARDQEHLRSLRAAGLRSSLLIPLVARGSVLGALTLVVTVQSRRSYIRADVTIAEELARRAAQAMDNARLYSEAQAALHARDEFLMIASHELRTPVTAVRTASQLLQRRRAQGQLDDAFLDRALRHMGQAGDRLVSLTEDLLDVSRLQSGHFELHPVDLDLVLFAQDVVERWRDQLGSRHPLRLEVGGAGGALPVRADPARLEQVLANLLGNAAKYSPEGGPIDIWLRRDGNGVRLDVHDRGIGLPPDAEAVIFRPFGRGANATERQIPGLGMGLYICRQIIERHGGRIWAERAGAQTTVFSLWLPSSVAGDSDG